MHRLALAPLLLLLAGTAPEDERDYMVAGFERLRVDGPFAIEVVPGSPGATATGDPRALDRVAMRVEGTTLIVSTGTQGWELRAGERAGDTRIRITGPALRGVLIRGGASVRIAEMRGSRVDLALNGSGALDVGKVTADDLNVTLTGTGGMTLAGTAGSARMRLYGAGGVEASGLMADDATLISQTSGVLNIGVRHTARVTAFGTGGVRVIGRPVCTVSGSGPVECETKMIRRD